MSVPLVFAQAGRMLYIDGRAILSTIPRRKIDLQVKLPRAQAPPLIMKPDRSIRKRRSALSAKA
jgi:hypothetical protein